MNTVGPSYLTNIKTYYKATLIKIVWYWHKDRLIYRWMEKKWESRNKPTFLCQLIFDKGTNTIKWGKISFSQMVLGKLDINNQKNGFGLLLHIIYNRKIDLEWTIYLKLKAKIIKLLEKKKQKSSRFWFRQ